MAETRKVRCACGVQFDIVTGKRGRPPTRCADCQTAKANGTLRERLANLAPNWISQELGVAPEELERRAQTAKAKKRDENAEAMEKAKARVDNLELMLKANKSHISQHDN